MDDLPLPWAERLSGRQWALIDAVVAALVAALSASELILGGQVAPTGPGWTVTRYLALAIACASLPLRRRYPGPVLAAVGVSVGLLMGLGGQQSIGGGRGGLVVLALPLAVYSVVVARPTRPGLVAGGTAIATVVVGALVARGGPDGSGALLALALGGVGVVTAENTRGRRAYLQGMMERTAEREREREREVRRAGAEERFRIARELHDVVAHAMSIIAVRSGVGRMALDTRPEEAREALGIIEGTSRQALQELRTLLGVLRGAEDGLAPAELGPTPGLSDLEELVAKVTRAGVAVRVQVEGEPRRLSPGVDVSAYRIVQEALTNVVRHAAPATAELTLRYAPGELAVEVTDESAPGRAVTRAQGAIGTGQGLVGMRERVAVYGGTLLAEPTSSGWRVLARIPTEKASS